MTYFEIHINPNAAAGSDVILVNNFHPKWREAVRALPRDRLEKIIGSYAETISEWSHVPMDLEFSEYGLHHIRIPTRSALDLWPDKQQYRSHNIHSAQEVGAAVAVLSCYIAWLNFELRRMESH